MAVAARAHRSRRPPGRFDALPLTVRGSPSALSDATLRPALRLQPFDQKAAACHLIRLQCSLFRYGSRGARRLANFVATKLMLKLRCREAAVHGYRLSATSRRPRPAASGCAECHRGDADEASHLRDPHALIAGSRATAGASPAGRLCCTPPERATLHAAQRRGLRELPALGVFCTGTKRSSPQGRTAYDVGDGECWSGLAARKRKRSSAQVD